MTVGRHAEPATAVYGRRKQIRLSDLDGSQPDGPGDRVLLDRQALHALSLGFFHPMEGKRREFTAPLPDDMEALLEALREHRIRNNGGSKR